MFVVDPNFPEGVKTVTITAENYPKILEACRTVAADNDFDVRESYEIPADTFDYPFIEAKLKSLNDEDFHRICVGDEDDVKFVEENREAWAVSCFLNFFFDEVVCA